MYPKKIYYLDKNIYLLVLFFRDPSILLLTLLFVYTLSCFHPLWNKKVDEYIIGVFDFGQIFLASDGVVFLFHPNDLKVLKVKFYFKSFGS